MKDEKVFHLKGKTRKTVQGIRYITPAGTVAYTTSKSVAMEFNKRFAHLVLPARERSDGAA
jgi:hypothetical protein